MLDKQLSVALSSAIKAGEYVLNIYNKNDFEVEIKDDNSPVTIAD